MLVTVAFVHRFISSLVFTDVVETAVLLLLVRYLFRKREFGVWKIIFVGLYASFSTIPYVWFVFPNVATWPYSTAIIYAELFAFVIEAIFYRIVLKLNWRQAFLASLLCNLASYLLGPFLRTHGLWLYW